MSNPAELREQILKLSREYSRLVHASFRPASDDFRADWQYGDPVPYAGRVFDEQEVEAAVSSSLDFWLTLGSEGMSFQEELASYLGVKKTLLVNSGSSANLIAISLLSSLKLTKKQRINPGDEVITVAAGFPTTVAPIVQIGAIPVFVDADPVTGNVLCSQLDNAYREGKTKAVVLAHSLGNPFDIGQVLAFCRKHDIWLVEDNCDSLGSSYSMPRALANTLGIDNNSPGLDEGPERIVRWTGSWGDVSTQSFYPPHHLTMGEGGAVNIIHDLKLSKIAESLRDWGRDCWCPSGVDGTCNQRFGWQLGDLPAGYDHKYTYSHIGYNLKPLDYQAAIGRVQLKKLHGFICARKENWSKLRRGLDDLSHVFEFSLPTHAISWDINNEFTWDSSGRKTDCSWFGFKLSVKPTAGFTRTDLARYLDEELIGNRMLFGGNLVRQPAFVLLLQERPGAYRQIGNLLNSDNLMKHSLFLGTFPGLTESMLNNVIAKIHSFVSKSSNA